MESAAEKLQELNKRLSNTRKEMEALGHILNCKEDQVELLIELKPSNFHSLGHKEVFEMCLTMFQSKRDISEVSVKDFIDMKASSVNQAKMLKDIVTDVAQYKIQDTVQNSIAILKDITRNRMIYYDVIVKAELMFQRNEEPEIIVDHIAKVISGIEIGGKEATMEDVTASVIESILNPNLEDRGLETGLLEIDHTLGGIKEDRYITIGAAPGVGKTAMLVDFFFRLCDRHAAKVAILFFSLEMSEERIVKRFISHITGLNVEKLEGRMKALTPEQRELVRLAGIMVKAFPIEIVYKKMNCHQMELRAKKFAIENPGKKLIIALDHIGLVTGDTNDIRMNTIKASQTMKGFCVTYKATSFVLTQLKKELLSPAYAKTYHKPDCSFIMESGQIHQDSDAILLLWRPEMHFIKIGYRQQEEWDTAGKLIALNEKNRDGQPFTDMLFQCDIGCNRLSNTDEIFLQTAA